MNELVGAFNDYIPATFSLGGLPQTVASSEPQFLVRQHTWALYTCYGLAKALEDDLQRKQETAEAVQSSLLSSLEYLQRNLKCLADLLNLDVSPIRIKVQNLSGGAEQDENSSRTSNNQVCLKTESKIKLKQNTSIAIAFLKKICRLSKHY